MLVGANKSISLICFLIFRFLQLLFSYRRVSYENECLLKKKFDKKNGTTGLTRTSIIQKHSRQIFTTHKHRKKFQLFFIYISQAATSPSNIESVRLARLTNTKTEKIEISIVNVSLNQALMYGTSYIFLVDHSSTDSPIVYTRFYISKHVMRVHGWRFSYFFSYLKC